MTIILPIFKGFLVCKTKEKEKRMQVDGWMDKMICEDQRYMKYVFCLRELGLVDVVVFLCSIGNSSSQFRSNLVRMPLKL